MDSPRESYAASVAVSVDGRLVEDRFCVRCGYNLRTQLPDGRCPECNTPVAESLVGLELVYAPLGWLRTIGRGFGLLRTAIVLALLSVAGASLGGLAAPFDAVLMAVLGLASFAALACLAVGFFLATQPEPRTRVLGEGWTPRRVVRWAALAAVGVELVVQMIRAAFDANAVVDLMMLYAPLLRALLVLVAVAACSRYVVRLLERTAEQKVLKSARETWKLVRIMAPMLAASILLDALVRLAPGVAGQSVDALRETSRVLQGCGSCLGFLAVLAGLVLVFQTAGVMKRTISIAESRATIPTSIDARGGMSNETRKPPVDGATG